MRSLVLALSIAALSANSALAAAPRDYTRDTTHAISVAKKPKLQWVQISFRNPTLHPLNVRIGDAEYRINSNSKVTLRITVGAVVQRRDEYDSHRQHENVMQVSATDDLREVLLS